MDIAGQTMPSQPTLIGERAFSAADQERFARLSFDRNPMHMDPVAARRLMTGLPVVHGVHLLLTALEFGFVSGILIRAPAALRCNFNNPVSVGDLVVFRAMTLAGGDVQIDGMVGRLTCCSVMVHAVASLARAAAVAPADRETSPTLLQPWRSALVPLDEPPGSQLGQRYEVELCIEGVADAFAQCTAQLGPQTTAAIAGLSYLVGMVCPGLHSTFSSLSISRATHHAPAATLNLEVIRFDQRVQLYEVAFDGCIEGSLKAFRRPPPQRQPSMDALRGYVSPGEFSGSRALVIGGSRGLGELSARLLVAGGADVTLSYAAGKDDALALCSEIEINTAKQAAQGRCRAIRIDLLKDRLDTLELDWSRLNAIFFFATPRIFRKKADVFDSAVFAEFKHFYVDRFYELCALLEAQDRVEKIRVLLPSTTGLEERTRGMTEYVMAKAAAEVLAQDINRSYQNVSVTQIRLPRLNTDQTASILKPDTGSNLDVMLPILRAMCLPAAC